MVKVKPYKLMPRTEDKDKKGMLKIKKRRVKMMLKKMAGITKRKMRLVRENL